MPDAPRQHEAPPTLLPTLTDPGANAHLRRSLELLRDNCPDPALRRRLEGVLSGTESLRDLADSSAFEAFATPLAQQGAERLERLEAESGGLEGLARRESAEGDDATDPTDPRSPEDEQDSGRNSVGTW